MPFESQSKFLLLGVAPESVAEVSGSLALVEESCVLKESSELTADFLASCDCDVVLLDVSTGQFGTSHVRSLRDIAPDKRIVVLTPREARQQRLEAIEAGADDFIFSPIQISELESRIEVLEARRRARLGTLLSYGPLKMDLSLRRVERNGRQIALTPTEFRILEILLRQHEQIVTRRMLCESLWNPDWEGVTNVIEVHINRLRTKLNRDENTELIHTVRGQGYTLRVKEPEKSLENLASTKLKTRVLPDARNSAVSGAIVQLRTDSA
ncbi:MAG: response regulator transcription factor [Pirellulaceae bacterium]